LFRFVNKNIIIMKNFFLYLLILLAMSSCTSTNKPDQFSLDITISNVDGKKIFLNERIDNNWKAIDSVVIVEGKAAFKGTATGPKLIRIGLEGSRAMPLLFIEPANILLTLEADNLNQTKVIGSATHSRYVAFSEGHKRFDEEIEKIYQQYVDLRNNEETEKAEEVYKQIDVLMSQQTDYLVQFIKDNPADLVSHFLLYRYSHIFELEQFEPLVNGFDQDYVSEYLLELRKRLVILQNVAIGKPFTDFTLNDPSGNPVALSSKVGSKLLLVDFWASWCGPCRRENPNIVAIYNDYKEKGFDVFGVSLDRNRDQWVEAIEADQLTWTHVSDLAYWDSEAGKLYGINSIPHSVLLDENGIIIAKNLSGEKLREKVASLLN